MTAIPDPADLLMDDDQRTLLLDRPVRTEVLGMGLYELTSGAADAPAPSLGQQLDHITKRMDAATAAWVAAGYPDSGPVVDAREAVFADLRAWNLRVSLRTTGKLPS